jgi:hypothetical protein
MKIDTEVLIFSIILLDILYALKCRFGKEETNHPMLCNQQMKKSKHR